MANLTTIPVIEFPNHSYMLNENGKAAIEKESKKQLYRPANKFVMLQYMEKPFSFSYKALEVLKLYDLDKCINWALEMDYIFIYKRPGQA